MQRPPHRRRFLRSGTAALITLCLSAFALEACQSPPREGRTVVANKGGSSLRTQSLPPQPTLASTVVGAQTGDAYAPAQGLIADREHATYTDEVFSIGAADQNAARTSSLALATPGAVAATPSAQAPPPPAPQPVEVAVTAVPPAAAGQGLPQASVASVAPPPVTSPLVSTPAPPVGFATVTGSSSVPATSQDAGTLFQSMFNASGLAAVVANPAAVAFPNGSAALTPAARHTLGAVASLYHRHGGTVRVVGQASESTVGMSLEQQRVVNGRLSFDRAQAAAAELIRLGVPAERMVMLAQPNSVPSGDAGLASGVGQSRGAVIFIDY